MTTLTPNYNLKLYDASPTGDGLESFLAFRLALAGNGTASNMYLIDAALKSIQDSVTSLASASSLVLAAGTRTVAGAPTEYTSTSAGFEGVTGTIIVFVPDNENLGTAQLELIGSVTVTANMVKYDLAGSITNLEAGDLLPNHSYLYMYDGTRFVWLSASMDAQLKAYYNSAIATMTNKRITPRVYTVAYEASPTIDTDSYDIYEATAASGTVTFQPPSGTPTKGQKLLVRVTASGTQSVDFSTSTNGFRPIGVTFLTSIASGKTAYFGFVWNALAGKWDCPGAKALEV